MVRKTSVIGTSATHTGIDSNMRRRIRDLLGYLAGRLFISPDLQKRAQNAAYIPLTITLQNRAVNTYTPLRLPLEEEPISPRPNPEWSEAEIRRLLVEAEMSAHAWAVELDHATTPESQPTSTPSPRMGVAAALTILVVITALALLARP